METRREFFSKFLLLGTASAVAACRKPAAQAPDAPATANSSTEGKPAKGATDQGGFWQTAAPQLPKVEEISRHPTELPDSADYTFYQGANFQKRVASRAPKTIEVHWEVKEGIVEMVPGTTVELWTFEGKIPGPMVRAREGDRIDFYLHNPASTQFTHNVDFHAVTGPGGGSVVLDTRPGSTSHLQVKVIHPGIYIYHCAFPPIASHIAHGMYGLVVVEPRHGLPAVDHEYYLMQSEFYTTLGGKEAVAALGKRGHVDFSPENAMLEEPTFVTFNGRPDAVNGDRAIGVMGDPIKTGETIRLFVGNIGPNLPSSFHLIGEMFDRVYMNGSFDTVGKTMQSVLIPCGGALGVEIKAEVPGNYTLVDHSIFRINKGALGTVTVQGAPNPELYDPIEYSHVRD